MGPPLPTDKVQACYLALKVPTVQPHLTFQALTLHNFPADPFLYYLPLSQTTPCVVHSDPGLSVLWTETHPLVLPVKSRLSLKALMKWLPRLVAHFPVDRLPHRLHRQRVP